MKPEHGLSMYYRAVYIKAKTLSSVQCTNLGFSKSIHIDLWFEEVCELCRGCKLRKQSLNFFEVKKYITIGT